MGQVRILHVTGDEDFAAASFEEDYGVEQVKQDLIDNPTKIVWDDPEDDWSASLDTYTDIDPRFIVYIKGYIVDYEFSKDTNFYVID